MQESVKVKHRCFESRSVHALVVDPGVESRLDPVTDLDVFLLHLVGGDQRLFQETGLGRAFVVVIENDETTVKGR